MKNIFSSPTKNSSEIKMKQQSKISLQNIFDLAWQKFIIENAPPAKVAENQCCYLTPDGKKCAVGLSLPDGHESQQSSKMFDALVEKFPELFDEHIQRTPRYRLREFQRKIHDNLCWYSMDWIFDLEIRRSRYIKVAEEFDLTVPSH